jgi:hypothetical protein
MKRLLLLASGLGLLASAFAQPTPVATTASTRPPLVRICPSSSRRLPAWKSCRSLLGCRVLVIPSPWRTLPG